MIPETRDQEEYDKLHWSVRLTIRLTVYLLNILNAQLKPYRLTPVFAIYEYDDEEIEIDYDEEDETIH